ncbi:hypothetical protein [Mycolicibacterium hassiacum]|uniref:hypothetical protein n=1 Tax=Mycolicibacterium hassiacum TaxID=46351 RepID=UPI000F4C3E36|nr:hypothetical protein [Mycolicibacterium hassiacum]
MTVAVAAVTARRVRTLSLDPGLALQRDRAAAAVLGEVEAPGDGAVELSFQVYAVVSHGEREQIARVGNLVGGTRTDPGAGPDLLVLQIAENLRAVGDGR